MTIPIIGIVKLLQFVTGLPLYEWLYLYIVVSWVSAFVIGLLFAILLALLKRAGIISRLSGALSASEERSYPRVWNKLFIENPDYVFRFKLTDGTIYYGKVNEYSKDPNFDDKEVLLERCVTVDEGDDGKKRIVKKYYDFSYLSYEDIVSIDVLQKELVIKNTDETG